MKNYTAEKRRLKYLNFLDQSRRDQDPPMDDESEPVDCQDNKATDCNQPVFLKRNLRKMKQTRTTAFNECVQQSNGMIARMIPLSQNLYFEVQTEDFMHFRRIAKASSKPKETSIAKGKDSRSKKLLGKRSAAAQ